MCSPTAVALIASVVCVVGCLLLASAAALWYWVQKQNQTSRRLFEGNYSAEAPADQKDLPVELRNKYQAVKLIGRSASGVVLEAQSKTKRNLVYAIKLAFPAAKSFSNEELTKLDRKVCPPANSRYSRLFLLPDLSAAS